MVHAPRQKQKTKIAKGPEMWGYIYECVCISKP